MKLGILTAPFPDTPLTEVADWAAFGGLRGAGDRLLAEVLGSDPPLCRHRHIDVADHRRRQGQGDRRRARREEPRRSRRSATIPTRSIPTRRTAQTVIDHLKKVIVAAGRMGVAGRQHLLRRRRARRSLDDNWEEAAEGLARHHRPCARQRRQADLRELPDDLQLRRMAGRPQHRLFAAHLAPHPRGLGRRRSA